MKNFLDLSENDKLYFFIGFLVIGSISFMTMLWFLASAASSFDHLKGSWGIFLPTLKFIRAHYIFATIFCLPGVALAIWAIIYESRKKK